MTYGTRYEKKGTPYGVFFFLLVLCLFLGYCLSGLYKIPGASLENLKENLTYVFTHPLDNWNDRSPGFLALGLIAWAILMSYITYYYRDFHSDIEEGSEDWLDPVAACRQYKDEIAKYNRILSENLWVSLRDKLSNNNAIVIGSPGSFKTTGLMHQNLLQFGSCYVVLDVKGDTQRKLGKRMQKEGYTVKSLNFKQPEKSDRWNPFVYIEKEIDMLRIIEALHGACRPNKGMSMADPFWDDAVKLRLQSVFYYAWLNAREKGTVATMNDVIAAFRMEKQVSIDPETGEEITALASMIHLIEEKFGPDYPPVRDYKKFEGKASETVSSVELMLDAMLAVCETGEVQRIFSGNDINLRELGTGVGGNPDKKIVLFLVLPDTYQVYNWIVSMFYTQMFDILVRLSDDELHAPLPVPVEVWMDELYAGPKPGDLDILTGTVRSRNISIILMVQSIAQFEVLYKENKWKVFMDNAATVIYLGSGPLADSTHEYISKTLGKTTMDSRDDNIHRGHNGNSGLNFKRRGRELMTPGEVKRIPRTECVVFLESCPPIYDRKAIPFNMRGFKANDFLKKRYKEALDLGPYEHPVYTVYDPEHFSYVTIDRGQPLQVVTDPKEIETLKSAAKKDPDIYVYNIDEKDLLYLSWGRKHSKEEVGQMFRDAVEAERKKLEDIRGLSVLQDSTEKAISQLYGKKKVDKSTWDQNAALAELLADHWDELSAPEQEEICAGLGEGLTEEQLKILMLLPLEQMSVRRRAYAVANSSKKK